MMGKRKRRVYLVINVGLRKNETAWQPAAAAAKDGRFRRHHVPPSCIIYSFRIGCLFHVFHLSVNAGMENARLLPVLLLPPPSVLILLSPLLTSSITTNGRKSSIFDTLVHFEFRRDCDLGGDRRVPPA